MSENRNPAAVEQKRLSGLESALERWFHIRERGSTIGQEITAGLSVYFLSVCALFLNIQIVAEAFSSNAPYCGLYLAATLTAFLGTILMGILTNLPLVQTASLSMSAVLLSTVGAGSGLTYANLMAVTLTAALVYLAVTATPACSRFLYRMIPDAVRKALPAAMGLYMALTALNRMGILDGNRLALLTDSGLGGAVTAPYLRLCVIAALTAAALMLFHLKRKTDNPVFSSVITATLLFFLVAAVAGGIAFNNIFTQNRIWIGINPDPLGEMYTMSRGLRELSLVNIFADGFDFSGYSGNAPLLFLQGILMFLLMGSCETEAAVQGTEIGSVYAGRDVSSGKPLLDGIDRASVEKKALLANAVTNVIAPLFGAAPVSAAQSSIAAAVDGARTGFASLVCAAGYGISLLTWLPFAVLATYTASIPEYGHAGFVFPNAIHATFQIVEAVLFVLGLLMLGSLRDIGRDTEDWLPALLVVVLTGATGNIACAAAVGIAAAVLMRAFDGKGRTLGMERIVACVLAVVLLLVTVTGGASSGSSQASTAAIPTDTSEGFVFDDETGAFTFTGEEGVEYYTVWVYRINSDGSRGDQYVAASSRLTGTGEIHDSVDVSTLAYGTYEAVLHAFGSEQQEKVHTFHVTGVLSVPEFLYHQDGTDVIITLYDGSLSVYNEQELFNRMIIRVYDETGESVMTEYAGTDDMTVTMMGPFTIYTCEKTLTLDPGTYQVSLTADGVEGIAETSQESERLPLTVAEGTHSEGQTSGYVAQDNSGMPF